MSSSADFPDWSVFSEREVPPIDIFSPASDIAALLQMYRADLDKAQAHSESVHRKGMEALAQQTVLVVQLASALERYKSEFEQASLRKIYRSLRIVKDQMLSALQDTGLEILVPQGKPFNEVVDYVDVVGWRHSKNFSEEVVTEVLEPIVLYNGTLLRLGQVVMGAPLEQTRQTIAEIDESNTIIHEGEEIHNG